MKQAYGLDSENVPGPTRVLQSSEAPKAGRLAPVGAPQLQPKQAAFGLDEEDIDPPVKDALGKPAQTTPVKPGAPNFNFGLLPSPIRDVSPDVKHTDNESRSRVAFPTTTKDPDPPALNRAALVPEIKEPPKLDRAQVASPIEAPKLDRSQFGVVNEAVPPQLDRAALLKQVQDPPQSYIGVIQQPQHVLRPPAPQVLPPSQAYPHDDLGAPTPRPEAPYTQHAQQYPQQAQHMQHLQQPPVQVNPHQKLSSQVIDISKLPRYGLLAPPLPRQPRVAGATVEFDRACNVFVRNRNILREALEHKSGWLENAPQRMWSDFTKRQQKRYVPAPVDRNRRVLPETQGYRLRILRINDLPMHTTYDGRTFEFQLGVTMYDEAYGLFYGNTVYSQPDGYDQTKAAPGKAIDLDFSFDVYYHTQISDPRCMAVVEVIMLERMPDGVVRGEYSLGWAMLPLFQVDQPAPGGPVCIDQGAVKPLVVPMVSGTPRYLLMRNVYNEDLRAPKVLQNCSIVFQAEAYPAMDAFIPLLPQDFLVTYTDVIPGLRRFDVTGQLNVVAKKPISTLANPMLCATHSVVLRRLQLAMPSRLHDLLQTLSVHNCLPAARPVSPGVGPGCTPTPAQPDHIPAARYSVRVGVHNGRTFVGPCYELVHVTTVDVPDWKVLQVPAPDAVFDYVMADLMTTIVVELMVTPPQQVIPGVQPHQYLVGWAAFVPFCFLSDDGTQSEVAVGVHRYSLCQPPHAPLLRDQPPLNWRAMLGDNLTMDVKDPLVEFQLFETGRTPIPPPLRCRFAVIEAQRQQEEHLGERPLEEVMAPVPVPQPICDDMERLSKPPPPPAPMPVYARQSCDIAATGTQTSLDGTGPDPLAGLHKEQSHVIQDLRASTRFDTSNRDQLSDLAAAMQRQIDLLTRAVDDLREERKTLRNSIAAFSTGPTLPTTTVYTNDIRIRQSAPSPTPEEIRRLAEMPATTEFGDPKAFSGAACAVPAGAGTAPSRVLLQQLYDAGMVDALPQDVQALLQQRGGVGNPNLLTMDLAIEAKDARMASDIVIQFLAFRHHDTLNAPACLQSAYFTFQFYHFPPTTSDLAYMVQPHPQSAPVVTGQPGGVPAVDDEAIKSVRILMSNHPMKKGAGLVLKYNVDGSCGPLSTGQTPGSAAYEAHMSLATYLAHKQLNIDMWDGESLLQVGTASLDLRSLLRQGRAFSELLVEVPLMMTMDSAAGPGPGAPGSGATITGHASPGANDCGAATVLSRGSVVVRIINIGKEPTNPSNDKADASRANNSKRVRVRVKPAWEVVDSPIAKELANGDHPDNNVHAQQPRSGQPYLQAQDDRGAALGIRTSTATPVFGAVKGGDDSKQAVVKHAILERSHRKNCRVRQLNTILESDKDAHKAGGLPPPGALGDEAFRGVQGQLLVDVASARGRNKDNVIRDQLRKNMVIRQVVQPGYGEVIVYEHEIVNPYSHEAVFELRISDPKEVSILTRPDEYRALKAAGARFMGSPGQPAGTLDQQVMAGNRIYLQASERVTVPFKIQSLSPPQGYASTSSASALTQAPNARNPRNRKSVDAGESGAAAVGHTVSVEVSSVTAGHPVGILELHISPKPLVIDRTFRFYHSERALMRQTIRLKHLPGGDTAFAGGALRHLAAAASHPEVITGTGSVGLAGGGGDRDEVYIKYTCGPAPEVTHFYVLLYADRLLSKPVEVWQVYVHALRKVDIRAQIGQTTAASVVVRGAATSRRVAVYCSHPDELEASPTSFVLVGGALTELVLNFRPVTSGVKDIKVHLVDVETRELVYALIVAAEASGPLVTRTFEIELPAGTVANKKITYTNPYQQFRTFTFRCNQPWLLSFTPPRLQLPAGATRPLGMTFDGRAATTGILDILVFVNDEEDRTEECFKVRCRVFR